MYIFKPADIGLQLALVKITRWSIIIGQVGAIVMAECRICSAAHIGRERCTDGILVYVYHRCTVILIVGASECSDQAIVPWLCVVLEYYIYDTPRGSCFIFRGGICDDLHAVYLVRWYLVECERSRFAIDIYGWGVVSQRYSTCLLYTSPSPRDRTRSRMPSSA